MIGSIAALLLSVSTAAAGCPSDEPAWLELEIVPSEPAVPEPAQRIEVHADGCVSVERARYRIDAGTYVLRLDRTAIAELAAAVREEGIDRFDSAWVRASVGADDDLIRTAGREGQPEFSAIVCGNTHRLTLRNDTGERTLTWYGLDHDVARHPDVTELVALKRFVDRLAVLADDARLSRVTGAEVAP